MTRTVVAAFLFVSWMSGQAVLAGPPEGPSGRMALDEVEDGLRSYRLEQNLEKRAEWLKRLAPTKDPRVAVALGEMMGCDDKSIQVTAAILIIVHYTDPVQAGCNFIGYARAWWKKNEADLRRRAKQVPD
jgi:hypothetical protein